MSQPTRVTVKRRRTEEAPDLLLLQGKDASQVRYVKKQRGAVDNSQDGKQVPQFLEPSRPIKPAVASQQRKASRRVFHLQSVQSVTGKRDRTEEHVATFAEQKKSRLDAVEGKNSKSYIIEADSNTGFQASSMVWDESAPAVPSNETYKRPGKSSVLSKTKLRVVSQDVSEGDQKKLEELAEYMHQAALEEAEKESFQISVAAPKLSAERARQLHQRRTASNSAQERIQDNDSEDDNDYEFETYVLDSTTSSPMQLDKEEGTMSVGYLVISEQDQELWETFIEEEANDNEGESGEEDENAEDYYGADYPEDEVDSDDEFDRDARRYRADDDEWDEDTGTYSEDEYDRMMDPFGKNKIPQRLAKYLQSQDDQDDD